MTAVESELFYVAAFGSDPERGVPSLVMQPMPAALAHVSIAASLLVNLRLGPAREALRMCHKYVAPARARCVELTP